MKSKIIKTGNEAFGWPGIEPKWATAKKTGVGTACNSYSKVWFSIANGIITEVYYPTLDTANTKELQFIISYKNEFVEKEEAGTYHKIEYIDPKSLAYKITNTDKHGYYKITKNIITDPLRNALILKCSFEILKGEIEDYRLYAYYDPRLDNSGNGDTGYFTKYMDKGMMIAFDSNIYSALATSIPYDSYATGFVGRSDGWTDISHNNKMNYKFDIARNGNIAQTMELSLENSNEFLMVLSFGKNEFEATSTAYGVLEDNYEHIEKEYIRGWNAYCKKLDDFNNRANHLYYTSLMIMKAFEDKTYPGAMIASLSIPWGETVGDENKAGYHLVWSRDLYHTATAFMAAGDTQTANRALDYLDKIQQNEDGSFPQNSWLNGNPHWGSLQMDEVAAPIILAWRLGRKDLYYSMIKPAADFIINNGPITIQERWEELCGYSPSTIAAEIAGLVCASEIAEANGDVENSAMYLDIADKWQGKIEEWCFTSTGFYGNGNYYLRISPYGEPNKADRIFIGNGAGEFDQREIVDISFLELVRLGIKRADDPYIRETIEIIDSLLKAETKKGVGWYRYSRDGYGETQDGKPYQGIGKGRVWPIFTGERGHYELALGNSPQPFIDTIEAFANESYILSEQVWEISGEPTGSATPLAWSHAEYVRLFVSSILNRVSDTPQCTYNRYVLGDRG